jgi:SnoaL-like protein
MAMFAPELRAQFERMWTGAGVDNETAHALYAPDAVLEFPQSEERFEGVENFKTWRAMYPGNVEYTIRRLERWGDLVVSELLVSYDGGLPMYGVALIEMNADDQIVRERIYVMDGWEAPDWRSPWRSATPADASL